MTLAFDVALLAPVPEEHLTSGLGNCHNHGKVAFGSRAFETFYELEHMRRGLTVDVYIYASHTKNPIGCQVSWRAIYIGFIKSEDLPSKHEDYEDLYRPETTKQYSDDTRLYWPLFWEVTDLQEIATHIPIHQFTGRGRKRPYQKIFVPEGPLLIEYPYI
jgi:hypothetical protein